MRLNERIGVHSLRALVLARASGLRPHDKVRVVDGFDFLFSPFFVVKEIDPRNVAAVALPHSPAYYEDLLLRDLIGYEKIPVVVDANNAEVGRTPTGDFFPQAIVVFGQTTFERHTAEDNGKPVLAYVGTLMEERKHVGRRIKKKR